MPSIGFSSALRRFLVALSIALLAAGCQAVLGDFHVDNSAFGAGGASNGAGGMPGTGGMMAGLGGDGMLIQSGPIRLMPTVGLYTTEWGTQATLSIVLDVQPTADVTVALSSSNPNEGKVSPASVTFTKDDWKAPQLITVTGVDDDAPDGNQTYQLITAPAVSDDPKYSNFDAVDVTLTNIDNETAGITVVPTSGLVTSENGMQDTFTVVLNSKPASNVSIDLSSDTPTEGTVSPTSLVFTPVNWMAPQLVTVTGVDDPDKDGPKPYKIVTAPAKSDDHDYDGVDPADVQVTNQDNETAGVTVVLVTGIDANDDHKLRTSESGDTATFTVQLNAPPAGDVTIPLSSSAPSEGTVSPSQLTFTKDNWNAPQSVTVMGIDDQVADGDQPYQIVLGIPTGSDPDYGMVPETDVSVTNVDNDKPGFTIMRISAVDQQGRLTTDEAGGTATFTIALNSMPRSDVSITLSSSLPSEGSVSPTTLTFTSTNGTSPQTVTVKGVDDNVHDGDQTYYVRTSAATSDDPGYKGLDPDDVLVANLDNDSAEVRVVLVKGINPNNPQQLATSEAGDSATFTVALASQPIADVSIALVSSNTKEGTVSPSSLKFTAANYGAPQTVTVTGVDDKVADGDQTYVIAVGAGSSPDPDYNLHFGKQVSVSNIDNDQAGITVNPVTGLTTSEAGVNATFTIKLTSQPTADVVIPLSSSKPTEGKPNVSSLTFTALNYSSPQTVTVLGQQDDNSVDGNQTYKIIVGKPTTKDTNYANIDPPDVSLTNIDDDSAGFTVMPQTGLMTSEAGTSATFAVSLTSRPMPGTTVKIGLTSNRPTEGTVSPASLTFTPDNYASPQTVTVTGVDDPSHDGPQPYKIVLGAASSVDLHYNGLVPHDVSLTNIDNDSPGVTFTPTPLPTQTTEKGGTATIFVALNSQPSGPVTFTLSSSNTAEGVVSPATLTFTVANYKSPQAVTVTGVDDSVADGNVQYNVTLSNATSSDPDYNGHFGGSLQLTNVDDDHPGVLVSAGANLQTSENGVLMATFTVVLLSRPTAAVTVGVSSSNTAEGVVAPASLAFSTANWNVPQLVTVTGVDDKVQDGPQTYQVIVANAASMDSKYNGSPGAQLSVTNLDDDQAGFVVSAASNLHTTEAGGTATFSVVLTSQPRAGTTVSLPVLSSNTKEGVVSSPLLFSAADWSSPHTVTITGVDDKVKDGGAVYTISFGAATSADMNYSGKSPPVRVTVINDDDDTANVVVTPTSCSTTPGATATFTIVLTSQPIDSVSISLTSDMPSEGTVSPASVSFTTANWNVPQTVTVTGVDDGSMGATTAYNIVTGSASSPTDTVYDNLPVSDVACTNTTAAPTMPPATP